MDSQLVPKQGGENQANGDSHRSDRLRNIITLSNIKSVVPIISNSFYIDEVLRNEEKITDLIPKRPEDIDEDMTINEQLTKLWAHEIDYPMTDDHNLARVAQYYQVKKDSSDVAKEDYLAFLNSYLLEINKNELDRQTVVRRLKADARTLPLAEIVHELGYSKLPPNEDPLEILANVQFPVYITTSYHDFLERALKNAKRVPKTQVIFIEGTEYEDEARENEHYPIPEIKPTAAEPVVYHLFGLEKYPGSLIVSEDDYMKFLVSVVTDTDTQHPIVPLRLRRAITSSHLLLLGYHLKDWDFRVLFRFIMEMRKTNKEVVKPGICIQIPPKKQVQTLVDYLRRYFNLKQFDIEWKYSRAFTQELWDVWEGQLPHEYE